MAGRVAQSPWLLQAACTATQRWLDVAPEDEEATALWTWLTDREAAERKAREEKAAREKEAREQAAREREEAAARAKAEALRKEQEAAAQQARDLAAQVETQPGQLPAARAAAQRWLDIAPGDEEATALLKWLAGKEKEAEEKAAREKAETLRKEQETAAQQARDLAAQVETQPGQLPAARAAAQRWLEVAPGDEEATALLAWLADREKEAKAAAARAKAEALRKKQEEAAQQARDLVAQVEKQPAQLPIARATVQRWLKVSPGDEEAMALLAWLADREKEAEAAAARQWMNVAPGADVMVWEKDGKEMVRVPAGDFLYGERDKASVLPEFWIDDKTPVTNAEYARFIDATGHKPPEHWPKAGGLFSSKKKPPDDKLNRPVANISWGDAVAYAKWAGKQLPDGTPHTLPEFWIDKTPVTNAEYARFVEATGHEPPGHWQGRMPPADKLDHPVVNVSWHDAVAYAEWAGKRLPTEEEWEKAARGTDGRIYPWGNEPPNERLCNFDGKVGDTTPIGKYSPGGDSPYGCVDMAGNVWDWTASDWSATDKDKVVRGGSWLLNAYYLRTSCRDRDTPSDTLVNRGFRCGVARAQD